jgi:hypothetical protein
MKYLKSAGSEKEFAQLCHPNYAEGVQTVTYVRSEDEYNELMESYENNDENIWKPKQILHSSKRKTYECVMTWNYELYNGYHAIRVKINSFTPNNVNLNDFVLCLEMERQRFGESQTKTLNCRMLVHLHNKTFSVDDTSINNYYKVNPVLGQEYIFYICPRYRSLKNSKDHADGTLGMPYNKYFLDIKVRPTLIFKHSFMGNSLCGFQFDTDIWCQDYKKLHLQLDKFINLNTPRQTSEE